MGIENPVHLLFVAAVALIVLGPKRLPELARAVGKAAREFRESLNDGGNGHAGDSGSVDAGDGGNGHAGDGGSVDAGDGGNGHAGDGGSGHTGGGGSVHVGDGGNVHVNDGASVHVGDGAQEPEDPARPAGAARPDHRG
jgi:TatA/E family protein of Tat protein translocase